MSERAFEAMRTVYEDGLRWTLRHQTMMLVITILTFFASIWLYTAIPKGFVPEQDTGLIAGVTDASQDISFDSMSALQQKVADIIAKDPDVVSVTSFVGVDTENTTLNSGRLYIDIGSPDRRHASAAEIMERLRTRSRACTTSHCICSRCRISRSKPGRPERNTNTSFRTSTTRSCALG